jgi:hypothetical protein
VFCPPRESSTESVEFSTRPTDGIPVDCEIGIVHVVAERPLLEAQIVTQDEQRRKLGLLSEQLAATAEESLAAVSR